MGELVGLLDLAFGLAQDTYIVLVSSRLRDGGYEDGGAVRRGTLC